MHNSSGGFVGYSTVIQNKNSTI